VLIATAPAAADRIDKPAPPPSLFVDNPKEKSVKKIKPSQSIKISIATVTGALLAAVAWPLAAQETQPDCALRIGSGPKGKIYELMVQDIQRVCSAEVSICSVPSIGVLSPNPRIFPSNEI